MKATPRPETLSPGVGKARNGSEAKRSETQKHTPRIAPTRSRWTRGTTGFRVREPDSAPTETKSNAAAGLRWPNAGAGRGSRMPLRCAANSRLEGMQFVPLTHPVPARECFAGNPTNRSGGCLLRSDPRFACPLRVSSSDRKNPRGPPIRFGTRWCTAVIGSKTRSFFGQYLLDEFRN